METAAAAGAIYDQLEKCISRLYRLYRNFKAAKQEVCELMDEATTCQGLLEIFNDVCEPLDTKVIKDAREKGLENTLHSQAVSARKKIRRLSSKLKPLMKSSQNHSQFEQIIAKICWHFERHEGQAVLVTLGSMKATLSLLASLINLDVSLNRLSQPSTSLQAQESILKTIGRLEKTVQRQNESLKKLADKMHNTSHDIHASKEVSNTDSMVAIIQQLQERPVADAREVIQRQGLGSRRVKPKVRAVQDSPSRNVVNDTHPSRTPSAYARELRGIREWSDESNGRVFKGDSRSPHQTIINDYGDGSRERYVRSLSSSSNQVGHDAHALFVPMPPFTSDDLPPKLRCKGDRRGLDENDADGLNS